VAASAAAPDLPEILTKPGNDVPACVTPGRLMAFLRSRNDELNPRYEAIATQYMRLGEQLGLRWDFAFYQMIVETGALSYWRGTRAGDVKPEQLNFAGLGATGNGVRGESFKDLETGVRAHLEHILLYAGRPVADPVADRTRKVQHWGVLTSWQKGFNRPLTFADLATRWAPGNRHYGQMMRAVAERFQNDVCRRPDPRPELLQEARNLIAKDASASKVADNTAETGPTRSPGEELAKRAIAITDKRHPAYAKVTIAWPTSNPRGFARWLEAKMGRLAEARRLDLVERRLYATVEDVPTYELKTPLQRAIQLLKRHRDVMFADNPELAPISMILTNLSGHAYNGEADVYLAVRGILSRMLDFVRPEPPYVPNPTHPAEDYADKWSKDRRLELNFRHWHAQALRDFEQLPLVADAVSLKTAAKRSFRVDLGDDHLKRLGLPSALSPAIITSVAPVVRISSAPRPWGTGR